MDNEVFTGNMIWFSANKGIGFIEWYKAGVRQKDMFLHFSDIQMQGFRTVRKGDKVQFKIGFNNKGVEKAIELIIVK